MYSDSQCPFSSHLQSKPTELNEKIERLYDSIKLHENKRNVTSISNEQMKCKFKQFGLFHFRDFKKNALTPQQYQKIKDFMTTKI